MVQQETYELALAALHVSNGERTAALRLLRDECGLPLKDGLFAINAAYEAWERLYAPKEMA
jgi:hypothetical protein